jgi:hypothetical protein
MGKKILSISLLLSLLILPMLSLPFQTNAAVSDWYGGATISSRWSGDFSSDSFKQSLQNLRATGANTVALLVQYYQQNADSSDIWAGGNTPSDADLVNAINYAHSLGMSVTLKVHLDIASGGWRAYINPSNRDAWFTSYGNVLRHLATIGQQNGVEMIIVGTEMVDVTVDQVNSTNTQHWINLIASIRKIYSGKLTYGANASGGGDEIYANEYAYIKFWPQLDYMGLSPYVTLDPNYDDYSPDLVSKLKDGWDLWNTYHWQPAVNQFGKQIIFTEIGYRSIDTSYQNPWDYNSDRAYNGNVQASIYESLFSYWSGKSTFKGVYFWDWSSDPNAGGTGNKDYTPQHKPAEQTMKNWFTNSNPQPTPTPQPAAGAFSANGGATPNPANSGQSVSVNAVIKNNNSQTMNDILVDTEVYNSSGGKVFQQYVEHQNFAANETKTISANWTPTTNGTYTIKIGVFSAGWANLYTWVDNAGTFSVSTGTTPPPPPPPPPDPNPQPTPTPTPTAGNVNIWWPGEGVNVHGVQPFKAMLENADVSTYQMYWQVDGDRLNVMDNSSVDYPHKEVLVDLTGWNWKGTGPYNINFVAKDNAGNILGQKSVNINIQ